MNQIRIKWRWRWKCQSTKYKYWSANSNEKCSFTKLFPFTRWLLFCYQGNHNSIYPSKKSNVYGTSVLNFKKICVISKEVVGNSWDIVNTIFGHEYHHNCPKRFISTDWRQNLRQKVSTLSFRIFLSFTGTCVSTKRLCTWLWGSVHVVALKLDLGQTSRGARASI